MACLEHMCRVCHEQWFDNELRSSCPRCGSTDSHVLFDEAPEPHPEEVAQEEADDADL